MGGTSKPFLCCTLRTWAFVVAWIQLIVNGLLTILFTAVTIWIFVDKNVRVADHLEILFPIYCVLGILSFLLSVYLFLGVKKEIPTRLNAWLIIQAILTAANAAAIIVGVVQGDWSLLFEIISVLINIFAMYVVYKHRDELLEQQLGQPTVNL